MPDPDENLNENANDLTEGNHDLAATTPPRWAKSTWEQYPRVDRARVRVKRFDYIGHADGDSFFLQYGTANKKGELAEAEVFISATDFVALLRKKTIFTSKAFAHLWGCSLGEKMAPALAEFISIVKATEQQTSFKNILNSESALPVPDDGSPFQTYTGGG